MTTSNKNSNLVLKLFLLCLYFVGFHGTALAGERICSRVIFSTKLIPLLSILWQWSWDCLVGEGIYVGVVSNAEKVLVVLLSVAVSYLFTLMTYPAKGLRTLCTKLRLCRSCHGYRVSLAANSRTLLISFSSSGTLYKAAYIHLCAFIVARLSLRVVLLLPLSITRHCQTCECLCGAGMQVAVTASVS